MTLKAGILLFDSVNELDFIGPYEVLANSDYLLRVPMFPGIDISPDRLDVQLIAKNVQPLTCEKGLFVRPTMAIADCPALDILVVPGGSGVDTVMADEETLEWIRDIANGCTWVTSVCNGVFILAAAGLTHGKRVTTHWAALEMLKETKLTGPVLDGFQYVRDGNLVTSAGVSAGIDMALWVAGQVTTPERARLIQRTMQYDPAPPYAADV